MSRGIAEENQFAKKKARIIHKSGENQAMAGKPEQIIKDGEKTRFKPGQTGNPNGRPPGVPNTATRLQRFLNLVQKGKNPVTKEDEEFTVAELMDLQQIAKAMKGDTAAWEKLINRLEGMPKQPNEHTGGDGGPIEFEQTVINIAFRPPSDLPNESGGNKKEKGTRRQG